MSTALLTAFVSLLAAATVAALTAMTALRPPTPDRSVGVQAQVAGVALEAPAPAAPRLTEPGGRWVPATNPAPTTSVFARPAVRPPA
ncbi:MAG TPA: hypothetical protein VGM69_07030, partial [Chloroflexota bacterium]